MALSLLIRILECFANCLIFSLKVFYFSNTIKIFILFQREVQIKLYVNLVKWIKRGELLCRGYFHDTGMTFIRNESCPYYFLFTRYWTTFHSCTSNSRMSSFQFSMTIFKRNYCSGTETGNSSSWVESLCNNNYYKGSYGDLSNHYLGVKNSNKDTSEFLTCVFV